MTHCRVCSAETSGRFCSSCGAAVAVVSEPTDTISRGAAARMAESSAAEEEDRFPPGTVLAHRYRISGRIGRGGMGEVYKATDLLLSQVVALKFLPEAVAANEGMLERFRGEVRLARQISHPNVCRVYDLGEARGQMFLSMEYVDGEDLQSLLRRIGRLPPDKAMEIARKLCAGLNAAHEKGVVHRDLKPANIMLDGRGQARIMDFGLAGAAGALTDIRSGTPAYMAPEQRRGLEVTARSDIYALGIVLHELFTGKRPGEGSKAELDPAVERVLQRCLEEAPQKRPATALAVAAALPGGDPLAEALAAGETPTPEMVANAGAQEGLRVPVAVACLALVAAGLVGLGLLRQRIDIVNRIPHRLAPQALEAKAREIAAAFGYSTPPVDTASGWDYETDYLTYLQRQPDAAARWERVGTNRPAAISYWYRESQSYLLPPQVEGLGIPIRRDDPPLGDGAIEVVLDTEGRLLEFRARPLAGAPKTGPPEPDWTRMLAFAGLDAKDLTPSDATWTPDTACDAQSAWKGSWTGLPSEPLTVEAGAFRGRPVYFRVAGPWSRAVPPPSPPAFVLMFLVALPLLAVLLVRRNLRLGRGDRQGAFRVACFVFVCGWAVRFLQTGHSATMAEVTVEFAAVSYALIWAALYWAMYMAFEPYVRRRWPHLLVSWNRVISGRLRDQLVGGHLLAGMLLGVAVALLSTAWGPLSPTVIWSHLPILSSGTGAAVSLTAFIPVFSMGAGFGYTMLLILLRFVVRREWAALVLIAGFTLVVILGSSTGSGLAVALRVIFPLVVAGMQLWLLLRLGMLAMVAGQFALMMLRIFPLTTDLSAWYATDAVVAMAIVLAIAIYGFRTTLGSRPLWRDELAGN